MPKVTVIVPMHNSVEFLAESLASVERQTLRDIEVLCVDDASTDATVSVFQLFAADDSRFRLISFSQNRGVAAARNEALRQACGDYVAFLDDDDWYPSDTTLERLHAAAVEQGALIVGGSFSEFDHRTDTLYDDYTGQGHLSCFTFAREGRVDYRDWQGDFGFQRFLFQRAFLQDEGIAFPPLIRHEDPVFLVRAMVAATWFYAIPQVVYRYRFHHKPRMLDDAAIADAMEGIAEILAISHEHDLKTLRAWQIEMMQVYAADSLGLVFNEKELLRARARVLRKLTASSAFRHIADIAGSYSSFASEVLKRHPIE